MSRLICVFAGLVTLALALPARPTPADGPQSGIRRGPQDGPRLQSTINQDLGGPAEGTEAIQAASKSEAPAATQPKAAHGKRLLAGKVQGRKGPGRQCPIATRVEDGKCLMADKGPKTARVRGWQVPHGWQGSQGRQGSEDGKCPLADKGPKDGGVRRMASAPWLTRVPRTARVRRMASARWLARIEMASAPWLARVVSTAIARWLTTVGRTARLAGRQGPPQARQGHHKGGKCPVADKGREHREFGHDGKSRRQQGERDQHGRQYGKSDQQHGQIGPP